MTSKIAFTVGYQGARCGDLIGMLLDRGVTMVIDTLLHPMSRRPEYRRRAFGEALADHGIGYEWKPELGVPRAERPLAVEGPGRFRARYRGRVAGGQSLSDVVSIGAIETIALLCFEADASECHRLPLSDLVAAETPLRFEHLHVGRAAHPDDHPAAEAVEGP
jgi:hypothetical protein